MPSLYNKQSGDLLGTVSDDDVQVLIDELEEEGMHDVDYFVNAETVEILEKGGASAPLVEMLRKAIGVGDGIEIRREK